MPYKDPWLPQPPTFRPITRGINETMKVSNLIQQPGKWNSELIQQCFLIPVSQLILKIPLSPFDHSDAWLWHYSKNGNYSVKSGYKLAINLNKSDPSSSTEVFSAWWKDFWAIKIPKKILMFAWRGYHEILPTEMYLLIVIVHFVDLVKTLMHTQSFGAPSPQKCGY